MKAEQRKEVVMVKERKEWVESLGDEIDKRQFGRGRNKCGKRCGSRTKGASRTRRRSGEERRKEIVLMEGGERVG